MLQSDGMTRCACTRRCPLSFHPVCGSNSRTYWNNCFLRREACVLRLNLTAVSRGFCCKLASNFSGLVYLHLNAFSLKSTFINRFDLSTLLFLVTQRCHFATSETILLSKHSLEFLSLISSSLRFTTGNG